MRQGADYVTGPVMERSRIWMGIQKSCAKADRGADPSRFASFGAWRDTKDASRAACDNRPLLVIAGAGSGKTSTLAHRVARLIALKSAVLPTLPWAGTFHGIGARLLREYAAHIGLNDNFTIHDRGDAEDLMGWVRRKLGLSRSTRRFPHKCTCLSIYSRTVNTCAPLADVLKQAFPWCAE